MFVTLPLTYVNLTKKFFKIFPHKMQKIAYQGFQISNFFRRHAPDPLSGLSRLHHECYFTSCSGIST